MSRRVLRVDYKTLVTAIFLVVSLAVFAAVLDSIDARREAARAAQAKDAQIARRDAALSQAQQAANRAAAEAVSNGSEIAALTAQIKRQNDLVNQEQDIVSALRNALAKAGISTVIENGKVRVVPGPVSTGSGVSPRGRASSPTAAPTRSFTAPSRSQPSGSHPTASPHPTATVTRPVPVPRPTVTITPLVLPTAGQPLPTITLPSGTCLLAAVCSPTVEPTQGGLL